jgi:anti-sigma factor (TIGR02949 family)
MNHDHDAPIGGTPDCERALAEVYSFLDQELTDDLRDQIAAHLESCNPCFEAFDFEAELRMVISTRTHSIEVPDTLRIRIEEQMTYLRFEGSTDDGATDDGGPGGEA